MYGVCVHIYSTNVTTFLMHFSINVKHKFHPQEDFVSDNRIRRHSPIQKYTILAKIQMCSFTKYVNATKLTQINGHNQINTTAIIFKLKSSEQKFPLMPALGHNFSSIVQ